MFRSFRIYIAEFETYVEEPPFLAIAQWLRSRFVLSDQQHKLDNQYAIQPLQRKDVDYLGNPFITRTRLLFLDLATTKWAAVSTLGRGCYGLTAK